MYLKLSVAGHLTIFLTRTRGPFWSIPPAKILWGAVLGTQTVATLIAVFGIFMAPISWKWAVFVWIYALAWALVNDRVKLVAYWILDRTKAGATPEARAQHKIEAKVEPKPESRLEPKTAAPPETKAEPNPAAKVQPQPEAEPDLKTQAKPESKPKADAEAKPAVEPQSESKAEPKPDANGKTPSDLTPQIAKRAYELYEREGRHAGHSVQDWEKAEREIRKVETKPDANATEPEPDAKANEPKPDAKGPEPDAKAKTLSDLTPQLVKRVHELYEELGRDEVRAVQEWEKAQKEALEGEANQ